MILENQQQRNKFREEVRKLSDEEKSKFILKLYSEGTTLKLLSAVFECNIRDLINFFIEQNIKYCTHCEQLHPRDEFHKKNTTDGLSARCYRAIHEYRKEYYQNNKVEGLQKSNKWRNDNRDHVNELRNIRNKLLENKKKNAIYVQNKRKNDPIFNLRGNFSTLISYHLKTHTQGVSKSRVHWEDLVGYTLQDLVEHFESQFYKDPRISWNNYGQWHIDHIKPASSFNIKELGDDEFLKCWSLENLQPLWGIDNCRKGNRF